MVTPLRETGFSQSRQRSARGTVRIAETFISRQGEGKLTGTKSFFIRTSGCNLRCWFCDTPYASWHPEGHDFSIDELIQMAARSGVKHVVLTGGEPMLPSQVTALTQQLGLDSFHVTIETAGTINREVHCDLMSISPKFRSSAPNAEEHPTWNRTHEKRRLSIRAIHELIEQSADFQLKFVVDSDEDYAELLEIVDAVGCEGCHVLIMPQGSTNAALDDAKKWLEPWCVDHGFQYCDRMQIRWYGNRRGT
ncbi:MAG: 7-carboxy-7-deazaguanine synthase QueE [Planctomycetota bacterium]